MTIVAAAMELVKNGLTARSIQFVADEDELIVGQIAMTFYSDHVTIWNRGRRPRFSYSLPNFDELTITTIETELLLR